MKILMLTQWFDPEPALKGLTMARALRDRGHEVEVLTGFPNYPGGRLYPGYRIRPWTREVMDGIRVNRVALFPSHDNRGLSRIVNYLSFGASAALIGPWITGKPDILYVYNLVTLGFAFSLLRWFKGCRVVLDVQDLWPESVDRSGMLNNRRLLAVLRWWCHRVYRRPDRIIALSPGFKRHLTSVGVMEDRIEVIYNWCDESSLTLPEPDPAAAREFGFADRFNVIFAGTMGLVQSLDSVIECARKLQHIAPDLLFTFVGGGVCVEHLKQESRGLPNVQFLPRRSLSEMGVLLANSDALLVHLKNDPLFEITIPSKIQAYLLAGKPILCGVRGDASSLVLHANAGVCFTPEDADSLADAISTLRAQGNHGLKRLGDNGRNYYREHLAMNNAIRRMEALFESTIRKRT